jgi:uncharacterized protein YegL
MTQIQKTTTSDLSKTGDSVIFNTSIKPYQVRISRERPGCFVFLIDQSGSMSGSWGNDNSKSKADLVALYVNNALNEIINICQKSEPEPRPYFEVCVIGYGLDSEQAEILWTGDLAGRIFITPAELKRHPTGNGGEIEVTRRTFKGETKVKIPVPFWFSPEAKSLTPMGDAFDRCKDLLAEWVDRHPDSFPPIVINITDGVQTDCDDDALLEKAHVLKQTKTLYGNALLFNAHISSQNDEAVLFPESADELPDDDRCRQLYEMSSMLPEIFKKRIAGTIKKMDLSEDTEYIAMTYQGSVGDLTRFLDIGTKTLEP